MTIDNEASEVNVDHHLEDLELYQGLQAEILTDVSVVDSLVMLPNTVLRSISLQAKHSTEKKEFLSTKDVPICKKLKKK